MAVIKLMTFSHPSEAGFFPYTKFELFQLCIGFRDLLQTFFEYHFYSVFINLLKAFLYRFSERH